MQCPQIMVITLVIVTNKIVCILYGLNRTLGWFFYRSAKWKLAKTAILCLLVYSLCMMSILTWPLNCRDSKNVDHRPNFENTKDTHIAGWVPERCNSSVLALELHLSCISLLIHCSQSMECHFWVIWRLVAVFCCKWTIFMCEEEWEKDDIWSFGSLYSSTVPFSLKYEHSYICYFLLQWNVSK